MADPATDLFGTDPASDPLAYYSPAQPGADILLGAPGDTAKVWHSYASGICGQTQGDLSRLQTYLDRHVQDLGLAFRVAGDEEERSWPLNPMPLILGAQEWSRIEEGLFQRAELLETIVQDIYGEQTLISEGHLPAVVVSGSPNFARRMVGSPPKVGHYIQVCAFDLARGPDGEWRVLTDRVRLPVGIGYALENRLAITRATGGLVGNFNLRRLNGFFDALRQGMAARCERSQPRIALLTPGRFNQSYPEQAHLARQLGFVLVEGRDLVVRDSQLFVRTIAGLKRIDALWRWINTRDIDPLHFDSHSRIGVPNLVEACENGLSLANWPGAGVLESRAMPAFLPRLCRHLFGEPLKIPNAATWWCGGEAERQHVLENFDDLVISSAFRLKVSGLAEGRTRTGSSFQGAERDALLEAIARRPMDYTAQEIVRRSTMPALADGHVEARAFTLRAFLARDGDGNWVAMPGGFARISDNEDLRTPLIGLGDKSVDAWVIDPDPASPVEAPAISTPAIRREQGVLSAQSADNLFWLGRYGERVNQTGRVVRTLISQISGTGAETRAGTATARLANLLRSWGTVPAGSTAWYPMRIAEASINDADQSGSIRSLTGKAHGLVLLLRDRLSRDAWRIANRSFPETVSGNPESITDACDTLIERYASFIRLFSDGMSRNPAWRFLEIGLSLERAILAVQTVQSLVPGAASAEDLDALLDLADCQNLYRSRYLSLPTIAPVLDMVLLDPAQPRGIAFQLARIEEQLGELPRLREDGMPETAHLEAQNLRCRIASLDASQIVPATLDDVLQSLFRISEAIGRAYFLQQEEGAGLPPVTLLA